MSDSLGELRIQARASLFDGPKMESGGVGDGLDVLVGHEVVVVAGDGRMLADGESGNCLVEGVAEVGILVAAAVARPPACVHGKLHEVGEARDLLGSRYLAAGQIAKLLEIDGVGAFRR